MKDDAIVSMFINRDEQAIREAESKYQKYLMSVSYNICGNMEDSKECVSDTYLAAWNSIPPHHPENLLAYLSRLTRRISIDSFRKKNRDKRRSSQYAVSLDELEECIPNHNQVESAIDEKLLSESINSFLAGQDVEKRDIFIERYFYADSIKEIAQRHDDSQSKIKSVLFRLRNELKEHLKKEDFYE